MPTFPGPMFIPCPTFIPEARVETVWITFICWHLRTSNTHDDVMCLIASCTRALPLLDTCKKSNSRLDINLMWPISYNFLLSFAFYCHHWINYNQTNLKQMKYMCDADKRLDLCSSIFICAQKKCIFRWSTFQTWKKNRVEVN